MSYENDKQECACGGECDCNDVTEAAVQEEQTVMVEEAETSQHSCGCGGCGCH